VNDGENPWVKDRENPHKWYRMLRYRKGFGLFDSLRFACGRCAGEAGSRVLRDCKKLTEGAAMNTHET
jgi:hypothetical protein